MRSGSSRAIVFACAFGFVAHGSATGAHCEETRHVVIASTGASAILIWNATPLVSEIVRDRLPDDAANDRLERGALRAIAPDIPLLPGAKTITVRILYDKTGDVSPVYGGPTFAGVERYATVSCDAARARASAKAWNGLRDTDALPRWLRLTIVGELPERP